MGLFGALANPVLNIGSTLINNAAQKKAQQREFANNKEMWNLANQYNDPSQQMARLKKAGLNPNLAYGSGSVAGNTSTQTPKYQAPQINRLPLEKFNPLEILSNFADLRQKTAEANLSESKAAWYDKDISQSIIEKRYRNFMNENITGTDYQWNKSMPKGSIGHTETGLNKNLQLEKYQSEVLDAKQRTQQNQINLDFYKNVPKEFQWLAPFIMKILK